MRWEFRGLIDCMPTIQKDLLKIYEIIRVRSYPQYSTCDGREGLLLKAVRKKKQKKRNGKKMGNITPTIKFKSFI